MHCASIWIARDHFVLFQRVDTDAVLNRGPEVAGSQHVGFLPHAVLWVVGEEKLPRHRCLEGISEVGAGRIAGLRNGDAVVKGKSRITETTGRELAQKPAVHELVV